MKLLEEQLESLVDQYSLKEVLSTLAGICFYKSDHIREFWQDIQLSIYWKRAAQIVTYTASSEHVKAISEGALPENADVK